MGVTDRRMWFVALGCCVALSGLALSPWLTGGGYEVNGTRLPLVLGISRSELLIVGAIAMAAISLLAIRRPDLQNHSAPILSIVALGAFILCASTVSADWRFGSCGWFGADRVIGNHICVDNSDVVWGNGAQATLSLWAATGLSAFLMLWSSASWFRLEGSSSSKVNEVNNGWA
jgi:hypothetical protein